MVSMLVIVLKQILVAKREKGRRDYVNSFNLKILTDKEWPSIFDNTLHKYDLIALAVGLFKNLETKGTFSVPLIINNLDEMYSCTRNLTQFLFNCNQEEGDTN